MDIMDVKEVLGPSSAGGLFEYATQAVYFCELWTWCGFALLSSGPNGLFILLVYLANLVPRSKASHAWYLETFGQEPPREEQSIT